MNRRELAKKLGPITSELLKEKGFICIPDVFIKLGYLDLSDYERWRMREVPYLEKVIKANLGKISFIVKTVRKSSINDKLKESLTHYKSWGKGKKVSLRFSKTGNEHIEKEYATHFLWNNKLEKKKISAPPFKNFDEN